MAPEADVTFLQCSAQDLPVHLEQLPGSPRPNLTLFHAVIEWTVHPREALAALQSILLPDG